MSKALNDFLLDVRRAGHTETHTVSMHLFNDWTERVQIVRSNSLYNIPDNAVVYARYNPATNETEIHFTWTTIDTL